MMTRLVQKFQQKSTQMWPELLQGIRDGDAAATTRLAHALKGTASNLSAPRVTCLAARLEELGRSADLGAAEAIVDQLGTELERCAAALTSLAECRPEPNATGAAAPRAA